MKIGILTFHWATNYGAILQAWCLQEYLEEHGHTVDIINYKPVQYDFSWKKIVFHPKTWRRIHCNILSRKKEIVLSTFRENYLHTTRRFFSSNDFGGELEKYDAIICGSDQVLNPWFTCYGQNGKTSDVYWLNLGRKDAIRIGYAVSFGCNVYPDYAVNLGKGLVNVFNAVGTRERFGINILEQLDYKGPKSLVPDPTLLVGAMIFRRLGISKNVLSEKYTCIYMLRREMLFEGSVKIIDDKHQPLTMEEWLSTITNAHFLITNSYHGMIIAILSHVPFVVLLESDSDNAMKDRFYTLLDKLNCTNRIATNEKEIKIIQAEPLCFDNINKALLNYKKIGEEFLLEWLSN